MRYHARWVLPVSAPPIEHATVVVNEGGLIVYVGPRAGAPPGRDRELGEAVLLPGLINIHSHLELTAMRGLLENLPFRDWILRLHRSKRAVLTAERLLASACGGIAEGLLAGITTYADTCDTGIAFDAMVEMGVRGRMYQEVFGPDPGSWEPELEGLIRRIERLRERTADLVDVGVSPHAPYTVCDELFSATAAYAIREQLPVAVHIAESEFERRLVVEGTGHFADGLRGRGIRIAPRARTPVELLGRVGVLDAAPLLIHCIDVDERDMALIRDSGSSVAHCPIANAKLGHGIAPAAQLVQGGIEVALGSDSVAANNRMDLLEEGRVAILMQRALRRAPDLLSPAQAIEMMTIVPARILGIDRRVGSLEEGKDADLTAFSLAQMRGVPATDPASALVMSLGGSTAQLVTVHGRELVSNGRLARADGGAIARNLGDAGRALAEWHQSNPVLEQLHVT